jgi:hypothetical protein
LIKRLAAILAALGLTLMVAAPAWANDLHQTLPIASDSSSFQGTAGDCVGVAPGTVLWHFVHTDTKSSDLGSKLTVTFSDGTTQIVNGYVNGNSIVMYDVTTTSGVSLLSASDSIINDGLLNLSHICNGGPVPVVPEAPFSALLVLTGGLAGLGFVGWRMRQNRTIA